MNHNILEHIDDLCGLVVIVENSGTLTVTMGERAAVEGTLDALLKLHLSELLSDCAYEIRSLKMTEDSYVWDEVLSGGMISDLYTHTETDE